MRWDVFISHATEDKDRIVRPLAAALKAEGLRVWLDETEIRVGDSLRGKIDEGLIASRFGVVVLSRNFFARSWPQLELDGLVMREEVGQKIVLPIWVDLTSNEVARHSPLLASRLAIRFEDGLEECVNAIVGVVRSGAARGNEIPREGMEETPQAANTSRKLSKMPSQQLQVGEPIMRLLLRLYEGKYFQDFVPRRIARAASLCLIFSAWFIFSLVAVVFFHAFVREDTREKFRAVKEAAASLGDRKVDDILEDEPLLETLVPSSVRNLVPLVTFPPVKRLDERLALAQWVTALRQEFKESQDAGYPIFDTLFLYAFADLGIYLDRGVARSILLSLSLVLISLTVTWANRYHELFDADRKVDYPKRVLGLALKSDLPPLAAAMVTLNFGLSTYFTQNIDSGLSLVSSLRYAAHIIGAGIVLFIVAATVCLIVRDDLDIDRHLGKYKVPLKASGTLSLLLLLSSVVAIGGGAGSQRPVNVYRTSLLDYDFWARLVTDYALAYGLMVAVFVAIAMASSFKIRQICFSCGEELLYGLLPSIQVISVMACMVFVLNFLIVANLFESPSGHRAFYHYLSLGFSLVIDVVIILLVRCFYKNCVAARAARALSVSGESSLWQPGTVITRDEPSENDEPNSPSSLSGLSDIPCFWMIVRGAWTMPGVIGVIVLFASHILSLFSLFI